MQQCEAGQEHVEVDGGIVGNDRAMEGGQAVQLEAIHFGTAGHCADERMGESANWV